MNTLSSDISKLVGRMIIVGLKGHDEKDAYNFFEENRNYPVGGIILYDEDITTIPSSPHNIRSPAHATTCKHLQIGRASCRERV